MLGDDPNFTIQYAAQVMLFSSQYGSEQRVSYTASNLIGEPAIYPRYGDFSETCVVRSYGKWWRGAAEVSVRRGRSSDFVDVLFERRVRPTRVDIYETYTPGAVVRVSACSYEEGEVAGPWYTLWSGDCQPQRSLDRESRIFSLQVAEEGGFVNLLRLELNSNELEYYTELDAVKLHGYREPPATASQSATSWQDDDDDAADVTCQLRHGIEELRVRDERSSSTHLLHLPLEILYLITSHLDLHSLCKLSRACRALRSLCYDPSQWLTLDLHQLWWEVSDDVVMQLIGRCRGTRYMDLSWCGPYNQLTGLGLVSLPMSASVNLTRLLMSACDSVSGRELATVTSACPNLTLLDVSSCTNIPGDSFHHISNLADLQHLNLYRSKVTTRDLVAITKSCRQLTFLCLGSCTRVDCVMDVLEALATHSHSQLRHLDLWRCPSLTAASFPHLHTLIKGGLRYLELGWCIKLLVGLQPAAGVALCLHDLVGVGPREGGSLVNLGLAALRRVTDNDLAALATSCPRLEVLELLGSNLVTRAGVERLLTACRDLKMMDLSFCSEIDVITIREWKRRYPGVEFKRSFQS